MEVPSANTPVGLLMELEQRWRTQARELPRQIEVTDDWLGIGFRLGKHRLVAPLGEVVEILPYPSVSKVPGAKSWVRGIANVRGNLLPIMDLHDYLRGRVVTPSRLTRVLVIEFNGVLSGLVVDEVLGLRHFLSEERTEITSIDDEALAPYLSSGFRAGDQYWSVFSTRALVESPQFLQAAV
jgi:twitching motility protein PilI